MAIKYKINCKQILFQRSKGVLSKEETLKIASFLPQKLT